MGRAERRAPQYCHILPLVVWASANSGGDLENRVVHALHKTYRGLSLVVELNADRLLFLLAIVTALLAGGVLVSL